MSYPELSPFEILEISPDATIEEIVRAYPQAVKNKKFSPNILAKAFSELRNVRQRAEYDLLIRYDLKDSTAIRDYMSQLPPFTFLPDAIDPLPITLELTDLAKVGPQMDFHPPLRCPLSFETSDQYQEFNTVLMPLFI